MKIDHKSDYTLLTTDEKNFSEFLISFKSEYPKIDKRHLIICFSDEINVTIKDLLLLLSVSVAHKQKKLSFICVVNQIEIDQIPEELSVVPTLNEAEDLFEMEEIERDLGF